MISMVETGRRRLDLDLIPRLADLLNLNPRKVTMIALQEYHPVWYKGVFGAKPPAPGGVYVSDVYEKLNTLPRRTRGAFEVLITLLSGRLQRRAARKKS